jgi:hypothetical protein
MKTRGKFLWFYFLIFNIKRPDLSYDFNDENDTEHDPMPSTFDSQNK